MKKKDHDKTTPILFHGELTADGIPVDGVRYDGLSTDVTRDLTPEEEATFAEDLTKHKYDRDMDFITVDDMTKEKKDK